MSVEQDKVLLKTINGLIETNPFAWKRTSSEDCFLYPLKKGAFNFCKYLNAQNVTIIALTLLDSIGNTVSIVEVSSIKQPELFEEFSDVYNVVKKNISQYEIGRFNQSLKEVSS